MSTHEDGGVSTNRDGEASTNEAGEASTHEDDGASTNERTRRFGAKAAILTFFAFLAVHQGVWLVALIALFFRVGIDASPNQLEAALVEWLPAVAPVALVLGSLAAVLVVRRLARPADRRRFRRLLRWGGGRWLAVGALVGTATSAILVFTLLPLIPVPDDFTPGPVVQLAEAGGWGAVMWVLLAVFLAPPVEEVVFRGFLLEGFVTSWGTMIGVLASSFLFGVLHVPQTIGAWPAVLAIFFMGIAAAVLRLRSGSIGPAVAAHAAYNATIAVAGFS